MVPSSPHRELAIQRDRHGRLSNTGPDVDALRRAVNVEIDRLGLDDFGVKHIHETGPVDTLLLRRARGVAFELGAPDAQLTGPLRPWLQILVRAPRRIQAGDHHTGARAATRMRARQTRRVEIHDPARVLARRILEHRRIGFYPNSTGNDRDRMVEIVNRGVCWCPHTRQWVDPPTPPLASMIAAGDATPTLVTAYTGGHHMDNSRHYVAKAWDASIYRGDTHARERAVADKGGKRNGETDHEHYDFWAL